MIEVEGLSRRYGDFRAVEAVGFAIGRSEVVGLLGHNGAGKTTVMKMLTGYLEPDGGTARIDGLDVVVDRRAVQALIGYLPENCPVYPEMTVVDYLDYHAGLHGLTDTERPAAVRDAITRTWLQDKALASISTLSRGYRQRVGVAQAILHRPRILILDEPTNGLDPTQIRKMRELIRELAQTTTVIISTHILQEVEAVCDRVLVMRAGRLVLDARLDALEQAVTLTVVTDAVPAQATGLLAAVPGVRAVAHLDDRDGRHRYRLDAPAGAANAVAQALVGQGMALFELHPQHRDLDTLFRELNEAPLAVDAEVAHG